MKSKSSRIPIPLSQRLRRARYRLVPLLIFALAAAGTIMLWGRHTASPNAFGAVNAVRYDITSPGDGMLTADAFGPIELFTTVDAGQIIARLDDAEVHHELAALRADLLAAQKEIAANEAELRQDDAIRLQERTIELRRLALNLESIRLDLLDRQAELESAKISLSVREEQFQLATRLRENNAETDIGLLAYKLERDVAARQVMGLEGTVKEAASQYAAAEARLKSLPDVEQTSLDAMLAPLRAVAVAAEERLRGVEGLITRLTIRAPSSGMIVMIFKRPGQTVREGEPLFTIADPKPSQIVSYVRSDQRLDPKPGMTVIVRSRVDPTKVQQSRVVAVGNQVEAIPLQYLRSPPAPEWGLPVAIELPQELNLRPGELVDLSIRR